MSLIGKLAGGLLGEKIFGGGDPAKLFGLLGSQILHSLQHKADSVQSGTYAAQTKTLESGISWREYFKTSPLA